MDPTQTIDILLTQFDYIEHHLELLLPWSKYLSEAERAEFFAELAQVARQSRQTSDRQPLRDLLEDWEATAECLQDPDLIARLLEPATEQDSIPWETVRATLPGNATP